MPLARRSASGRTVGCGRFFAFPETGFWTRKRSVAARAPSISAGGGAAPAASAMRLAHALFRLRRKGRPGHHAGAVTPRQSHASRRVMKAHSAACCGIPPASAPSVPGSRVCRGSSPAAFRFASHLGDRRVGLGAPDQGLVVDQVAEVAQGLARLGLELAAEVLLVDADGPLHLEVGELQDELGGHVHGQTPGVSA